MTAPEDIPDDPSTAVAVAWVHSDLVHYSWYHSMTQLLAFDAHNQGRIWRGGYVAMRGGTDGLAEARNKAVAEFLADSAAHWLWWVDTDMGFGPDTLERLLAAADADLRPVVGALCFANREVDNDGMGGRRAVAAPMILEWKTIDGESGFDPRWDYPRDTVVRCQGVGSACVLVHRSVFEAIQAEYGPNWYSRARNPSTNSLISEDLSFCVRAMSLDIPVHVHTGVPTTHAKWMWLAEEDYWRQRALNPPPPAPHVQKRDWTVPRYAVIPTHNRPALLLALVASLGQQCDRIVVLDNASDPPMDGKVLRDASGSADLVLLRDPQQPPNLARFWNVMFGQCANASEQAGYALWDVAVLNDDAVVPAGWYDACAKGLRESTAVIAHTNPTTPQLLTEFGNDPGNRMCPHAFVIRGELQMLADEDMAWWYFDSDLDQRARQAGGVLAVPGPVVVNSLANSTTVGANVEQAERDRITFEKKWANR